MLAIFEAIGAIVESILFLRTSAEDKEKLCKKRVIRGAAELTLAARNNACGVLRLQN